MDAPKAIWNPARDVWELASIDLFSEHSDVFSETWPISGMTRGGLVFELPTPGHRTGGSGCSLLPTPRTIDMNGPGVHGTGGQDLRTTAALLRTPVADEDGGGPLHPDTAKERGQTLRLTGQVLALTGYLLPTPRASDGEKGGPNQKGSKGDLTISSAVHLLPTPAANDSGNTPEQHLRKKPGREVVTSLQVIVDYDLLSTGGRIGPQSNGGKPSPGGSLPPLLELTGETESTA